MSDGGGIFDVLGIPPTEDSAAIRRAYALRLRENPPETDAHAFGRLRAAYEAALQRAARARAQAAAPGERPAAPPPPGPPPSVPGPAAGDAEPASPAPVAPVTAGPSPTPAVEASEPDPLAAAHARDLEAAREAYNELEARLAGRLPSTQEDFDGALRRLFTTASALRLSLWPEVEARVASLLVRHAPVSDPLLPEVARRFGWRRDELDSRAPSGPVATLLTRLAALEAVAAIRAAGGETARTLDMLAMPPPARRVQAYFYGLRHGPAVRRFVQGPISGRRELVQLLPTPTLDWWRQYGRVPRIGQHDVLFAVALSVWAIALVVGAARFDVDLPGSWPPSLVAVGAGALGPVFIAIWFGAVRWPRHWLQTREAASPSRLRQFGWILLALALPMIALGTGADGRASTALAILGVVTWIWASATTMREPPAGFRVATQRVIGFLAGHVGTMTWAAIAMLSTDGTMAMATAGAAGGAMIGGRAIATGFRVRLPRPWRWAGLALIAALCIAILVVLWFPDAVDVPWSLAAGLGASLVVLSRACWAANPIRSGALNRGSYYAVLFVVMTLTRSIQPLTQGLDASVTALRIVESLLVAWVVYSIARSGVAIARD